MNKSIAILFIVLSCSAYAADKVNAIPEEFIGTWVSDKEYCNDENIYNLEITSSHFQFWESGGSPVSIVTHGKNELAVIAEFTGEGETWIGFLHYQLITNNQLKDISDPYEKKQMVRFRCLL